MIFIPYNVPSLKNSKVKTTKGIFPSKSVKKYLQKVGIQKYSTKDKTVKEYKTRENLFRKSFKDWTKDNSELYFHFVRDSKRKFDFHNAVQLIADLMVAHDFVEDDNMDYFIPFPLKINNQYYTVDKENAGVYIWKQGLKY